MGRIFKVEKVRQAQCGEVTCIVGTVTEVSSRKMIFCSSVMNEQKLGKIASAVERQTRVTGSDESIH